jgi:K+-sensing histidine kinase KdpD
MGAEQENIEVEMVAVAEAVATAVDHIRPVCLKKNITIETDLDGTHVQADQNLVVPATASLLTNAINAMPAGGVLSVTLVDTDSQWELEVADSGRSPSRFNAPENTSNEIAEHPPVFIEFLSHQHEVGLLAQAHSGNMQTYPCPLGGSAHVLIVPKFANSTNQNASRRAA